MVLTNGSATRAWRIPDDGSGPVKVDKIPSFDDVVSGRDEVATITADGRALHIRAGR